MADCLALETGTKMCCEDSRTECRTVSILMSNCFHTHAFHNLHSLEKVLQNPDQVLLLMQSLVSCFVVVFVVMVLVLHQMMQD